MKTFFLTIFFTATFLVSVAQNSLDTIDGGTAVVIKDARIAILENKLTSYNLSNVSVGGGGTTIVSKIGTKEVKQTSSSGIVLTQGYRLMVISTSDRDLALKLRSKLYQIFPDQKQYMEFQMPNTKIKFGNFLDRGQADRVRKQIMGMKLVPNNIYIIPCTVEMKIQKTTVIEVEEQATDSKKVVEKKKEKKEKKEVKKPATAPKKKTAVKTDLKKL
jgi:hypothetical protein